MGVFSIFFLLLHFFVLGITKWAQSCASSKIHQGSSLYFVMFDCTLEIWKREGKLCQERERE
jgi:hypothetical protein